MTFSFICERSQKNRARSYFCSSVDPHFRYGVYCACADQALYF